MSSRHTVPLLVLALLAGLTGGCASTGGSAASPWLPEGRGDPWRIPLDAFPTQRLYRVHYEGPEGEAGFRITLYLADAARFRLRAADNLGRKVWDLAVGDDDSALWIDYRGKRFCAARSASRLAIVPLARLPLASLPHLLLGRLPAVPDHDLRHTPGGIHFRDARGQLWSGGLEDGRLAWWRRMEAGRAMISWHRDGDEALFEDFARGQRVRWREVVVEPLAAMPEPLDVPPRFADGRCG